MQNRSRRLLPYLASILVALLIAELLLHLASFSSSSIDRLTLSSTRALQIYGPPFIPDERLGLRGNPRFPEHDTRGFRNPAALDRVSIVALGDSHTYGTSVSRENSWPNFLAKSTKASVYNISAPGYGPAQEYELLPVALMLQPKLVVLGLYFGNDFFDDFEHARRNRMLSKFLAASDLERIDKLEGGGPLQKEVTFLFGMQGNAYVEASRYRWIAYIKNSLAVYSRLYGLLRSLKSQLLSTEASSILSVDFVLAKDSITNDQRPFVSVFDGGDWRTIFTSPYRLRVLDDSDLRIRAGLEISKYAIGQMQNRVSEAGARFVVLLLPTKEFIFWPKVNQPEEHKDLERLVRNEERLRREIVQYMAEKGIGFIDPTPALRTALQQPYFSNADGHPNVWGHEIISAEVIHYFDHEGGGTLNRLLTSSTGK